MTEKEATGRLKDHFNIHCDGRSTPYLDEAVSMAITALERQINNTWIPCDERLPKPILSRDIFKRPTGYYTNPVLVTVESEECDGTHRYVSTDMMRGKSEDSMEWMMSCGYGGSAVYSQKIIAWMPLPKGYKEET